METINKGGKPKKERLTDIEMFCLDAYIINNDVDTAYKLSRPRPITEEKESHHRLALRWRNTPLVQAYLKERSAGMNVSDQTVTKLRDKDSILTELEREAATAKGKIRADILIRIADLQRMKDEETKQEEERVHFYLPLPVCKDCQFKNRLVKPKE